MRTDTRTHGHADTRTDISGYRVPHQILLDGTKKENKLFTPSKYWRAAHVVTKAHVVPNSNIGLILMQRWKWHKVKVTRSKVMVKYAILSKVFFCYKITIGWMELVRIYVNKALRMAKGQVHQLKGQGKYAFTWKHCLCF